MLSRPSVFLASPGDLRAFRARFKLAFDRMVNEAANPRDLAAYTWEDDAEDDKFDHGSTVQEQIPSPADENCKAMVCFFAERIGTPMADAPHFREALGSFTSTKSDGFRPILNWQDGDENDGGFALTGAVFEVLVALKHNQDPKNKRIPLKIYFFGDETILTHDPDTANWGNRVVWDQLQKTRPAPGFWQRLKAYNIQVRQLHNFIAYLKTRSLLIDESIIVRTDDDALKKAGNFLTGQLELAREPMPVNPFKGLQPYDIEDAEIFLGRKGWVHEEVERFVESWRDASVPFLGIIGGSGTGKSSLLRAGLLASLQATKSAFRYRCLCVTASELLLLSSGAHGTDDTPLCRLVTRILRHLGCGHLIEKLRQNCGVASALNIVLEALDVLETPRQLGVHRIRLVIGLDQFEELLDYRSEPRYRASVDEIFSFIGQGCESKRLGFIFTLQSNRLGLFRLRSPLPKVSVEDELLRKVPPLSPQNISDVVRLKFKKGGITLSPAVIARLSKQAVSFFGKGRPDMTDDERAEEAGESLLPLLSLTLERLFEYLQALRNGRHEVWLKENGEIAPPPGAAIALEAIDGVFDFIHIPDELLSVERAIDVQAERALKDANEISGFDETVLHGLLRRTVRVGDGARLYLPDTPKPDRGSMRQLIDSLTAARLMVPVGADGVRLIHEAVVRNWAQANSWLDDERELLNFSRTLQPRADLWHQGDVLDLSTEESDMAGALLLDWMDVFQPLDTQTVRPQVERLREFCLAILEKANEPARQVKTKKSEVNHFLIATYYGCRSLINRFLLSEPDLARTSTTGRESNAVIAAIRSRNLDTLKLVLAAGADPEHCNVEQWQAIHFAANQGDIQLFKYLVARGGVNARALGNSGRTALHLAATEGHVELVRHLLDEHGFDPGEADTNGTTGLHAACVPGGAEVVGLMLGHKDADPSATDAEGWSPFHIACREADSQTVSLLLKDRRTDVTVTFNGVTPLELAIFQKDPEVIATLLGKTEISRLTATGRPALRRAIDYALEDGDTACVRALLDDPIKQIDINETSNGQSALAFICLQSAHKAVALALIRLLLDYNANANVKEPHSLSAGLAAAASGNSEALRLMIDVVDPKVTDADERTALHIAARGGHADCITLLLDHWGAEALTKIDKDGNRPLHLAAEGHHLRIIERLLPGPAARLTALFSSAKNADDAFDVNVKTKAGLTALHIAAERDAVELIEYLLSKEADPESIDEKKRTPFMTALAVGKTRAAEMLLRRNVNVDLADDDGETPLHLAVRTGMAPICQALLEPTRKLDVNLKNGEGSSPLHIAAATNDAVVTRSLRQAGADIEAVDNSGSTPLLVAIGAGSTAVFRLLLAEGASLNTQAKDGATALHLACSGKSAEIFDDVLASRAVAVDATMGDGTTPLHVLAKTNGDDFYVAALLERGASLEARDDDERTPLLVALKQGSAAAAAFLMNHNAALDVRDRQAASAFHQAIISRVEPVYRRILDTVSVDLEAKMKDGSTPLHLAARNGDLQLIEELLQRGAAREARNAKGETPLLCAIASNAFEAGLSLISAGAKLDAQDGNNRTALHWAIIRNIPQIFLKALGWNDVNLRTGDGQAPLHLAVKRGDEKMTNSLLQVQGIIANISDDDGRTPLHYAILYGHEALFAALLHQGDVDVAAVSATGRNALHFAVQTNNLTICEILVKNSRIDRNARTNGGKTARDLAALAGNSEISRFLDQ